MCQVRKLSRLTKLIIVLLGFVSLNGLAKISNAVVVISADGRYTNDKNYRLIKVLSSVSTFNNSTLEFSGTIVNTGKESLDKVKLVIDLYGEHELLKEAFVPIYQCSYPIQEELGKNQSLTFNGKCLNIPAQVKSKYKKHRISIGKQ